MATYETLLVESAGGAMRIALNRPEAMNAITPGMLKELIVALEIAEGDDAVGAVVLTGTGRAFSAGVDLKALGDAKVADGEVGGVLNGPAREVIRRIESMPKAVIAKVNGFCFTGALEIALACDMIVTAEEAKYGDTHAKWGLRPTWGMSQRLPRAVGIARARELSFTGRTFTGREAFDMGLAIRCVPLAELDAAVEEFVTAIVANSRGSIAAYKDLYRASQGRSLYDGLEYEFGTDYPISDTVERLSAFKKK